MDGDSLKIDDIGTNAKIARTIHDYCYYDIDVVSVPDFLNEGTAIEDCQNPDRLILGIRKQRSGQVLSELYEPLLVAMGRPVSLVDFGFKPQCWVASHAGQPPVSINHRD